MIIEIIVWLMISVLVLGLLYGVYMMIWGVHDEY